MKLVIQIPCYNEADTLPTTIADLPRQVVGFDAVEILVIDDGSTDGTANVAREQGADHVLRHHRNLGLAAAFSTGVDYALELGADVIVNTDGDNQYRGADIERLVAPVLEGRADIVVGNRQVGTIAHFSASKKVLQRLGSAVVRWVSSTDVADATSGFRAMSREAAFRLTIFSTYTYTLETIIQAGKKGLQVISIPVKTNDVKRPSRLIRSVPRYLLQSAATILRIFLMYEPLKVFLGVGLVSAAAGLGLFLRYLYFFLIGEGAGHIQSVILAAVFILLAFQVFLLGLLSDLIARNRRLMEDVWYAQRKSGNSYGPVPMEESGMKGSRSAR